MTDFVYRLGNGTAIFRGRVLNSVKYGTELVIGDMQSYDEMYFTVESLEADNTIRLFKQGVITGTFSYSTDNGITWTSISDTTSWVVNIGEKLLLKSNMSSLANRDGHWCIVATKTWKVYGNIMSLIYGDDYIGKQSFPNNSSRNFQFLFFKNGEGLSKLVDASGLVLPATTLTEQCYHGMFYSCPNLQNAPKLPATTLAYNCYADMFWGCSSLVTAPVLPATTLAITCYYAMFRDCTSLVTAPVLPATTLTSGCYMYMFWGCSSLQSITCYATDRSPSTCLSNWVEDVSATGDFYKTDTSWTDTGTSSIPSGWTQHDI